MPEAEKKTVDIDTSGPEVDIDLPESFPVISYHDAMERFGSDKPDMRFAMELNEFSKYIEESEFNTFKDTLKNDGIVKAIVCPS